MGDLKEGDFVERKDGKAFIYGDYTTQYAYVNKIERDTIRLDLVRNPYNLSAIGSFHQIFEKEVDIKRADDLMADIAAKKAEYNAKRLADALKSFNKFKIGQTVLLIGNKETPPYEPTQERVTIVSLAFPSVKIQKADGSIINISFSSLKLIQGGARKQKRKTIRRKRTKVRSYRRSYRRT